MKLHEMLHYHVEKAKAERWPLFVPAGTIEYHGEHLPLGVDTLAVLKALDEVEKKIPCVIAPTVWYGPSSYAVAGPEKGTIDVDVDRFEGHVQDILAGLIETGFRRIFVVIHHQFEEGQLMPEALSFAKAGMKLAFRWQEKEKGRGWWGSPEMQTYYEKMGSAEDPFKWVRVVPLVSPEIQKAMGYDHAGKLETSLMQYGFPGLVEMKRLEGDGLWFTRDAKEGSAAYGEKTTRLVVDYLIGLTKGT
jgi:creatinine amidohydrolase